MIYIRIIPSQKTCLVPYLVCVCVLATSDCDSFNNYIKYVDDTLHVQVYYRKISIKEAI